MTNYSLIYILDIPQSFLYNPAQDIIINGVQIFEDIIKSIYEFRENDWITFGVSLGQTFEKLIVDQELTIN